MTKREWIKATSLGACGSLLSELSLAPAAEAPGAEDDPPAEAKASDESDAVADIVTAYQLVDWARRMDPPAPVGLVAAAAILSRITLFEAADSRYADHIKAPAGKLKQDYQLLKGEARRLADEAVVMANSIKLDVKPVQALANYCLGSFAGGLNGPLFYTMAAAAGQTDTYQIKYKIGEWARVAVVADGDAALSLNAVNDQRESRGADAGKHPYVAFVPRKADGAEFTVTVTNRGKKEVVYHLLTN